MHVVITGAGGFVGRALVKRLLREHAACTGRLHALTLLDIVLYDLPTDLVVHPPGGCIAVAGLVRLAFDKSLDLIFYLASVPGGTAEQQCALARDVNLFGSPMPRAGMRRLLTPQRRSLKLVMPHSSGRVTKPAGTLAAATWRSCTTCRRDRPLDS